MSWRPSEPTAARFPAVASRLSTRHAMRAMPRHPLPPSSPRPAAVSEVRIARLRAQGIEVTEIVDHEWAKSIYFKDPNGLQLEFCSFTRSLNADDARLQDRAEISVRRLGLQDPDALRRGVPADGVMAETADRP